MRAISLFLLMGFVVVSVGACGETTTPELLRVGDRAPSFRLPRIGGSDQEFQSYVDHSSLDGELVVFHFWQTSCKVCGGEIPSLQQLYLEGKTRVIAVALDQAPDVVQEFIHQRDIQYPVFLGDRDVFERFDGYAIPYTLVLDRSLTIRKMLTGPIDFDQLRQLLEAIESGRPVSSE